MLRRILLTLLLAVPALPAADKGADKTLELLREVGGLQDQMKNLQKELEAKLAELSQAAADQSRITSEQTARSVGALADRVQKSLQEQQDQQAKTLAGVAGLNSQLQDLSEQIGNMKQAMTDLTSDVIRLSAKMTDLTTLVKTQGSAAPAQVEVSADDLWNDAETDRHGGKFDAAQKEYSEIVHRFPDSPHAADAQYYIGWLHYSNKEWDDAVKAFDLVLQNYSDSTRVPFALYYKADSLAHSGHAPEAEDVLRELRKKFPNHQLAKQSLSTKAAK